ncbi:Serpentine Receptor, class E (Epsilon) [Caenorhabditis elegans]|uniref:Serpentine Receptor, class E (Epsilon) n=1 Tax=Caenorhabditis elegans TaxID=6239 RepID=Q22209_CAEEL|nr:Serpentine Receptor, class E (Epsilon) [Caenorhabditis elegans]CCD69226.1 Serpentine Receptor, class E (Epsilon) [Caenorhabditis elegans]|eukprot:NP_494830.2 Serpentine Receptor, class E (epsilon) [Caenorhabditis elegans]
MIFLVNNSTETYFFPIFLMNYKRDMGPFAILMLTVEMLCFMLGIILTIRGCMVISETRVFNRNLNYILCTILLQFFENVIGRLLIMPYQKGWILLPGNDHTKIYSEFTTNTTSEMIIIEKTLWDVPYLFIGSVMLTHYMAFSVTCMIGITFERSLATYWINDYEKKDRPGVYIFAIVFIQTFTALVAYSAWNLWLSVYIWLLTGILLLIVNFGLFGYIWYWNIRVHRIHDNSIMTQSKYTLQARFQARENARGLEFTRLAVIVITMALLFECTIFVLQYYNFFQEYEIFLYYAIDWVNAGNTVAIVPLTVALEPVWRRKFFGNIRHSCPKTSKSSAIVDVIKGSKTTDVDTEEYFSQLSKAWA